LNSGGYHDYCIKIPQRGLFFNQKRKLKNVQ
jgi:hypothetical protein